MSIKEINKGDKVTKKRIHWKYWTSSHPYNENEESIVNTGTLIAKSADGVLIQWDKPIGRKDDQEWLNYKKINKYLGIHFPNMTENWYDYYEI